MGYMHRSLSEELSKEIELNRRKVRYQMKRVIDKGYSKCWMCIKDADTTEKEVIVFPQYGICLCDFHLRKMVSEYLNIEPIEPQVESEDKR